MTSLTDDVVLYFKFSYIKLEIHAWVDIIHQWLHSADRLSSHDCRNTFFVVVKIRYHQKVYSRPKKAVIDIVFFRLFKTFSSPGSVFHELILTDLNSYLRKKCAIHICGNSPGNISSLTACSRTEKNWFQILCVRTNSNLSKSVRGRHPGMPFLFHPRINVSKFESRSSLSVQILSQITQNTGKHNKIKTCKRVKTIFLKILSFFEHF